MYKFFVKQKTTTDKSPSEIHEIGRKEVARIKSELESLKTKMGYGSLTLSKFYDEMRNDPNNYYTTGAGVLQGYESARKHRDRNRSLFFVEIVSKYVNRNIRA